MAEPADKEDRTEAATARRLERAREEGTVAVSPELSALLLLGGMAGLLALRLPTDLHFLADRLGGLLAAAGTLDGPANAAAALAAAGRTALAPLGSIFALAVLAAAVATLGQTGFLLHPGALLPDPSRLSLARGWQRVFGSANRVNAGKSLLKLLIIGGALWHLLRARQAELVAALLREPAALPGALLGLGRSILFTALGAQACIAVLDLLLVRRRHAGSLRMSRHEIREEARESDGNPQVKAKLRRLRAQRARHRMKQAVAQATVVVTNPTHYAVALAYDRAPHDKLGSDKRGGAPRVVAKGVDEMAARIRKVAGEHRIPLVANPPLARALYRVELESDIPPEHYQAVAELIAYVWRLRGKAGRRRA